MLMQKIEEKYGVVFVSAAGNNPKTPFNEPQRSMASLKAKFVIGAVDQYSKKADFKVFEGMLTHFAPGVNLRFTRLLTHVQQYASGTAQGTSFGKAPPLSFKYSVELALTISLLICSCPSCCWACCILAWTSRYCSTIW
jgi:hypothetical protein